MYSDADLIPLSALQHLLFCERQCALIHVERLWAENSLTLEGRHMHKKADTAPAEQRGNVRISRGIALCSYRYGLIGKADIVEFHHSRSQQTETQVLGKASEDQARNSKGVALPNKLGRWQPMPVEYKRGKPKANDSDLVQLCAQALCLEEMLDVEVPLGAIFYGRTRRRLEVSFCESLRQTTLNTINRLHHMIATQFTPSARREPKCDKCSLLHLCMPDALMRARGAADYCTRSLKAVITSTPVAD